MYVCMYVCMYVAGLQSVEVLCGEARVVVNFTGIDFMNLLPKIPSMQASVEAHKIRPKGAARPAKS